VLHAVGAVTVARRSRRLHQGKKACASRLSSDQCGRTGHAPEVDFGGDDVVADIVTQTLPHVFDEQTANVVHVHYGRRKASGPACVIIPRGAVGSATFAARKRKEQCH
jgi:hypothetical protein